MQIVRSIAAVLGASVTFAVPAQLAASRFESHFFYGPTRVPVSLVEELVGNFAEQKHGQAFRHLGDVHDFFHGHLLYADSEGVLREGVRILQPFAILYHTQEDASSFSKSDPGGKYDYLDRRARNWVHFVGPSSNAIFNGLELMKDSFPDTPSYRRSLETTKSHYTVFTEQLDHQKFPEGLKVPILGQLQVDFYVADCERPFETNEFLAKLGVLRLPLTPGGEKRCLKLVSTNPYTKLDPEPTDVGRFKNDIDPKKFGK